MLYNKSENKQERRFHLTPNYASQTKLLTKYFVLST